MEQCPDPDVDRVRWENEQMRQGVRFQAYAVCYECGVPQAICDRFEANGNGGWKWRRHAICQYPGVIVGAINSMMTANINRCADAVWEWMRLDGVDDEDGAQIFRWMGQRIRWGGMEAALIDKVFYQLAIAIG